MKKALLALILLSLGVFGAKCNDSPLKSPTPEAAVQSAEPQPLGDIQWTIFNFGQSCPVYNKEVLGCFEPQQNEDPEKAGEPVAQIAEESGNLQDVLPGKIFIEWRGNSNLKLIVDMDNSKINWDSLRRRGNPPPDPTPCPEGFTKMGRFKPDTRAWIQGINLRDGWLALCTKNSEAGLYMDYDDVTGDILNDSCPDESILVARFKPQSGFSESKKVAECNAEGVRGGGTEICPTMMDADGHQSYSGWLKLCERFGDPTPLEDGP